MRYCWPITRLIDVPQGHHAGAFGAVRKYDMHTGVDIYTPEYSLVFAMEEGTVVGVENFTGKTVGSPWWEDTLAVLVEGKSGVILYGELGACSIKPGQKVAPEQVLGRVARVLKKDKGLPMTMLHLELYKPGTRTNGVVWELNKPQPTELLDPTPLLLEAHLKEIYDRHDA